MCLDAFPWLCLVFGVVGYGAFMIRLSCPAERLK